MELLGTCHHRKDYADVFGIMMVAFIIKVTPVFVNYRESISYYRKNANLSDNACPRLQGNARGAVTELAKKKLYEPLDTI